MFFPVQLTFSPPLCAHTHTHPCPPLSAPLKRREGGEGICLPIFLCFACVRFRFRIANDLSRVLACSIASQCLGVSMKRLPFFSIFLFLFSLLVLAGRRRHARSITPLVITSGRAGLGCAVSPLRIVAVAPPLSYLPWLFSLCNSSGGTVAFFVLTSHKHRRTMRVSTASCSPFSSHSMTTFYLHARVFRRLPSDMVSPSTPTGFRLLHPHTRMGAGPGPHLRDRKRKGCGGKRQCRVRDAQRSGCVPVSVCRSSEASRCSWCQRRYVASPHTSGD